MTVLGYISLYIQRYLGWRHWAVLSYNAGIENAFPIFYVALYTKPDPWTFVYDFFVFFLFSLFSTTYGYLVNDFSDRDLDRAHGKANTFDHDGPIKALLVVLAALGLSIVCALRFLARPAFFPLWSAWFVITTFYSLRPVRLKERGRVGLAFVILAQRVLPILIAFAVFQFWAVIPVVVFTLYIFFRGLSSDLNHQLEDISLDAQTGTRTYAVEKGQVLAEKIFYTGLEIEKILLVLCLFVMGAGLLHVTFLGVPLMLLPFVGYCVLYGAAWRMSRRKRAGFDPNPFVPGRKDMIQFIHHGFPSVLLPGFMLCLLLREHWIYALVFIFFVVYRGLYSPALMMKSFPGQVVRKIFGRAAR